MPVVQRCLHAIVTKFGLRITLEVDDERCPYVQRVRWTRPDTLSGLTTPSEGDDVDCAWQAGRERALPYSATSHFSRGITRRARWVA